MRRPYRRGLKAMDKPATSSKCRTHFWYIAIAAFLLWMFLLYLFNSSDVTFYNHERLFREEETNFTVSDKRSESVSAVSDKKPGENDDSSSLVSGNTRQDEPAGENNDSSSLHVSSNTSQGELSGKNDDSSSQVSGDAHQDEMLDDAKAVNDIVEELEKEEAETEKKKKTEVEGRTREKRGNRDLIVRRGRESRKARSRGRLDSKRKRSSDKRTADQEEKRKRAEDNDDHEDHDGDDNDNVVDGKRTHTDSENGSSDTGIDEEQNYFEVNNGEESQKDGSFEAKKRVEQQKDQSFEGNNRIKQQKDQSNEGFKANNKAESQRSDRSVNGERVISGRKSDERVIRRARNIMVRPRKTFHNDPCAGKYIYMHDLPPFFNEELLKNCWTLSPWTDMCELTSNLGLGPHLPDMESVSGFYATNQFTLEVIFHNRMKQYKCLTKDSSLASAVFVPYYAGLDVMRFLFGPFPYMRDAAALDLMKWLREKPEWKRMDGRDHFMIAGRTTWDFMRTPENESDWGNRLMLLPESRNMTMLLIEASPWNYHGLAIPYPTYFHPSTEAGILQWQNRVRKIKRRYLYSFVGASRPHLGDNIREEIMDQCRASRRKCKLLECVSGSQKCYKPDQIMKFFLSSTFCLQPPGDSFTRRSTFDSILAGCIPVFFHPGTAYAQYTWHFPIEYTRYSVFIPIKEVKEGRVSIERVLNRIPRAKVVAMREEVIKLITRVTYFDPRKRVEGFEDAFDVTVKGVLKRVEEIRKRMEDGKEEMFEYPEGLSWKYNMFGSVVGRHEWDSYFDRP